MQSSLYIPVTKSYTTIGYTKASVSVAMKGLRGKNLITMEEVAREDACRIEHDISEETFNMLKKHCIE